MKRSEMFELIEDAIKPCNSCYKEHRQKAAERILKSIEKVGMLPPPYKKLLKGQTEFRNASYETRYDPVTGYKQDATILPNWYNANEWEPEDEKK